MKGFRYLDGVATVRLDPSACVGCTRCVEVCPHQVFAVSDRKAHIVDKDACMECGACAKNCPTAAIEVEAGVGCATWVIDRWFGGKKFGGTGSCCG
ncbi:4Fe-4S binding protein [Geomonas sp. RF6]|uniref:mercury methylation ferredoxin HgcB n=1 Tax=Geomonas sp. RF6 TaxID=2897342 RepID=UPI001E3DA4B6|nr:mercury methylation ferredoxin HgcB [Geomonas sp. RF6]UFS70617.1 4Fe-4S binding protein [Geomonas sp. RF6]